MIDKDTRVRTQILGHRFNGECRPALVHNQGALPTQQQTHKYGYYNMTPNIGDWNEGVSIDEIGRGLHGYIYYQGRWRN